MKRVIVFMMLATLIIGVRAQQPAHKCQHAKCQMQASCQKADADKQTCKQADGPKYESLNVDEFAKQINSKNVVVVDVRTAKEYAEGHLKGALNVVWGNDFETQVKKARLCQKKTVAVYCRSGRRSKAAADALVKMGYNVIELDKGILGWQQAGKETEK